MPKRSRKPADLNKLASAIVDEATDTGGAVHQADKNQAAVELGRRGGQKGGKARAAKMTPQERSEAAKRAAQARWSKKS